MHMYACVCLSVCVCACIYLCLYVNIRKRKQTHRYKEQTNGEVGKENIELGEWEVQSIWCKKAYTDALYNMETKTNIYNK